MPAAERSAGRESVRFAQVAIGSRPSTRAASSAAFERRLLPSASVSSATLEKLTALHCTAGFHCLLGAGERRSVRRAKRARASERSLTSNAQRIHRSKVLFAD